MGCRCCSCSVARRRCGASTSPSPRRCPRSWSDAACSTSRASPASRMPRPSGTGCLPSCARVTGRIRSCARTWPPPSSPRTCWWDGPAHRPWRRRPRWDCRSSWCPIRTPPGTRRRTPARWSRPAARASSRTRTSTRTSWWKWRPCSRTASRSMRCAPLPGASDRPGAARVTADLLEALAGRHPLPAPDAIESASRVAA